MVHRNGIRAGARFGICATGEGPPEWRLRKTKARGEMFEAGCGARSLRRNLGPSLGPRLGRTSREDEDVMHAGRRGWLR